ncbi:IclR family transcriptional regulator [Aneurinibacillus sp. Ricciae_BoGa-3]|uniref:IclR family transcriptional regulator n=1 Tax=Aneurinibacillus sp. Ricciae_BoGa-3 TaxID=3022697 RepID=UPI002342646E|nr:IclR family transcriptional regulator [Aneurinibacillus sp. Ricciae_BoGa-3]WCK55191.1 IclR family transcriptional regulator [Aneurinibacillus sp. Ricciae_BoGa-3]
MNQSIDRAMLIIDLLTSEGSKSEWPISELARETSLPLGTLHRLLKSLIQHGLVVQVPQTRLYKAGFKWMEIGLRQLDKIDFRLVARIVMERLASEVEESIYLNIASGTDGIVIEKIDSPLKIILAENLGIRIPLHVGAPNKTMLANMEEDQIARTIAQLKLSSEAERTLLNQLSTIKRNGYAVSQSEKTENTASVAAPVIGYNNKAIAALSIGVPGFRFTEERLPMLIEKVKAAAAEISRSIGKV